MGHQNDKVSLVGHLEKVPGFVNKENARGKEKTLTEVENPQIPADGLFYPIQRRRRNQNGRFGAECCVTPFCDAEVGVISQRVRSTKSCFIHPTNRRRHLINYVLDRLL